MAEAETVALVVEQKYHHAAQSLQQSFLAQRLELATNIPTDDEDMQIQSTYKQRAKRLAEEILATKGSVDNATSLRQQLNAHKSQWLTAVIKCDPVFADKLRDEASVKSIMEELRT